jgi:putative endonuclease
MRSTTPHELGRLGEQLALEHYGRLGFELVARNQRTPRGELDLIVCDRHTIVFAEVKTRRVGGLDPLLSITPSKLWRLRALAAAWLAEHPDRPRRSQLRRDGLAVLIDPNDPRVSLEQREGIG